MRFCWKEDMSLRQNQLLSEAWNWVENRIFGILQHREVLLFLLHGWWLGCIPWSLFAPSFDSVISWTFSVSNQAMGLKCHRSAFHFFSLVGHIVPEFWTNIHSQTSRLSWQSSYHTSWPNNLTSTICNVYKIYFVLRSIQHHIACLGLVP